MLGEQALVANAAEVGVDLPASVLGHDPYADPAALLAGAQVVLLRPTWSLAALEEVAQLVAAHADPAVHVVAGGRDKHMTPAMNAVAVRSS
ncbi:hypothetical protein [Salana multivorans]